MTTTASGSQRMLVTAEHVVKHFPTQSRSWRGRAVVHAVDDISLTVREGETLGLVGETGSGKSTLGRLLLGLTPVDRGRVVLDETDPARLHAKDRKVLRRWCQIVFQDPFTALDPLMSIGASIAAPLAQHGIGTRADRAARVAELLELVGLDASFAHRRPAQCSGGQLQRIVIARALSLRPRFLVCDEPTSALDASVRAQVLDVLRRVKEEYGLTVLLISHDLRVVRHVCDRVAVMYLGQVVEIAERDELFERPMHPYTRALLAAALPETPLARTDLACLDGEPPSPVSPPAGCRFHPRCPLADAHCGLEQPPLLAHAPGHEVACFHARVVTAR